MKPEQDRTEKPEQTRTDGPNPALAWVGDYQPPRGIRFFFAAARPARPYGVEWRVDGKPKTKTFQKASAALGFAKALAGEAEKNGRQALKLADDSELRAWRAFMAELGEGVSLGEVLACWRRHGAKGDPVSVRDAIAAFLKAKEAEGVSSASLGHFRPVYDRVSAALGSRDCASVKREELERFVSGLDQSNESKRTNFKRIRTLFRWLCETRQISHNPCDGWKGPKHIVSPISVLPVEHAKALFVENLEQPRELLGRLALEAFAGIRHETAAKLPASAFDFERRTITIAAEIDKNRQEQFIEGAPDNLWAWLEWSKPEAWGMAPLSYRNSKGLAFIRARSPHPRNVLRHSFASYHIAANGDAGKTAAILTHSNLKMLWKHYRGKAGGRENGAAYFAIFPPKE